MALLFAKEGAKVVIAARSADKLRRLAGRIQKQGGTALAVPTDVTDPESVENLIKATKREFKRIDILVNNAGVALVGPITDFSLEDWHQTLEVNLTSAFLCSKAAFPVLAKRNGSAILNVSSIAGQEGFEEWGPYSASKAGLEGLTRGLAKEGRAVGIRVNAICPGATNTQMFRQYFPDVESEDILSPSDVAKLALFLVSSEASEITGECVTIRKGTV